MSLFGDFCTSLLGSTAITTVLSPLSGALVYRTTNQSLAANTDIPYQSEKYDTDNYFTVGTSAANFVIPTTGLYRVQVNSCASSSLTGTKSYVNGSGVIGGPCSYFDTAVGQSYGNGASGVLALNAADTVKEQNAFNTQSYGWNNDSGLTWHAIEKLAATTKYALAYPSTNQALTSGSYQTINFGSEVADTDGIHDTASNNSRMTVPSGVTRVRLSWGLVSSNVNASFKGACAKNGTTFFPGAPIRSKGGSGNKLISAMGPPLVVTTGDYFEVKAICSSGLSVITDPYTYFCLEDVPATIKSCIAKRTSNFTLNTAYQNITFDAEEYDDASIHDTSANTDRFVVPAGCTRARFHFGAEPSASSGNVTALAQLNGAYITGGTPCEATGASYGALGLSTPWLSVSPGDYFTVQGKTTSGTVTLPSGTWAALECE